MSCNCERTFYTSKTRRKRNPKQIPDPAIVFMKTRQLPTAVPEGVKRYYLSVPIERKLQAHAAGCVWDKAMKRWYIDNPVNLSDFAHWHPSLVGFEKLVKQLKQK